jgi:hypothetical protein
MGVGATGYMRPSSGSFFTSGFVVGAAVGVVGAVDVGRLTGPGRAVVDAVALAVVAVTVALT